MSTISITRRSQRQGTALPLITSYYNPLISQDDEEHQKKADHIVETIMGIFDLDKDGRISLAELEKGGLDALPNFDDAEGHHYDVESGVYTFTPHP